ncbi:MATE family efflux transporter [Clostridium butyricum]|uniref:MATE family efflux transporter n=1 Tax=Clostridium butyricum TaxID=1492 RepID=UPI0009031D4D|nr:MATE family efflux transporter [Clostridium butyricum]APF22998.1 matE family protein [Clostridium butyricum]
MDLESIRKNKGGMILQFSIPAIIAMILTSLITVTDGFFTGNYVGKEGIAAINIGLPIVYLYLGLGLMISVGGSVIVGIMLGAAEKKKCNSVFNQTIATTVIISVLLSLIILILFEPMMRMFNVDGLVAEYFKDYYIIMLLELPIMVINNSFGMFIRGEGNPQFFMKISIFNVLSNIIFDYSCVKFFDLGVRGIALASLISTGICFFGSIYYFVRKSTVYKFGKISFDGEIFKRTIFNGSSEFIGEMSMSITMYAYNLVILQNIGVDGVSAFTIVGYVAYLFSMILLGFGQGVSPLISFTNGADDKKTERELRKITNMFVLVTGIAVIFVMFITSGWYSTAFVKNQEVQNMVRSGVKIFIVSFLFSGINTISSFYFTSVGKAKESVIISSLRGLIILIILIFTLPKILGMNGVWLVAPITEFLTLLVTIYFINKNDKTYSCI